MKIESGLFRSMVLQRDAQNRSDARIEGTADADAAAGDVYVRVTSAAGKPVAGLKGRKIGIARKGRFKLKLAGIPTGGPYTVELSIRRGSNVLDTLRVTDVLVGDVWLAGGQSNMQGCGRRPYAAKPHRMVRAFYTDDRWAVAKDPIHNLWAAVDPVHADLNNGQPYPVDTIRGVGPAVAFAQEMFRLSGNAVPQGIIACAHGGTSMTQWDPTKKLDGGKSLYGAMLRRLEKNGGAVAGLIWYQGESDTTAEDATRRFTERTNAFIAELRKDTRNRRLPIAMVQLARWAGATNREGWNSVQEQQRRIAERTPNIALVPAIDLRMDDAIHIGTDDVNRLGRRLAGAMHARVTGDKTVRRQKASSAPPIALRRVRVEKDPLNGWGDVIVEFDHVQGKLANGLGRVGGFSVVNSDGVDAIFDAVSDTDRVRLRCNHPPALLESEFVLHYGLGVDPLCNVTDAADRSLPVLGPVRLGPRRAFSSFVKTWQRTEPLEGQGKLGSLDYPADLDALAWTALRSPTPFIDIHAEMAPHAGTDKLIYFRTSIEVPEAMDLAALLGYDGPVRLWIDGKPLYHDPAGTNPAFADRGSARFRATPGRHEILVALGTNFNRAWGIMLRFERLGLPRKALETETPTYALPAVG